MFFFVAPGVQSNFVHIYKKYRKSNTEINYFWVYFVGWYMMMTELDCDNLWSQMYIAIVDTT